MHTASDDRKSGLSVSLMAAFWHFISIFSLNLGGIINKELGG